MNRKQLQELVQETKERAWEIGLTGLRFDSPQKLEKMHIKSVNHLGISLYAMLEHFRYSTDARVIEALSRLEQFQKLQKLAGELRYSFEYKHPKKRKRKIPGNILVEGMSRINEEDVESLIEELEKMGFQEQMKEIRLKKLFAKADEGLKWDILQFVEKIRAEAISHLGVLVEKATEEMDQLVLEIEKRLEAAKKRT